MPVQSQMIIRDDSMRDGLKNIREFLGPFDAAWSAIEPALHKLRDLVLQVRRLDSERRIGNLLAAHTIGCREIAKLVNTVQGFASETGTWAEQTAYLLKALKHSELNNFEGAGDLCDALAVKINSIAGNVQEAAILGDQLAQAAASMRVFAMEVDILRNAFIEELADLEAYTSSSLAGVLDFVWETASCLVKLFGGLILQGSWIWNSAGKQLAEGVIANLSEGQLSWRQMRTMETIAYKEAIANLGVLSEKLDNGQAWIDTAASSTGFMETQLGALHRQVVRLQNPNVTMNGRLEIDPMIRLVLEIKREADNVAGLPLSKAVRGF